MARSSTRNATTRSYHVLSYQDYVNRTSARNRRALVAGRTHVFPRMEYQVNEPILGMFGCQDLRKLIKQVFRFLIL